LQTRNSHGLDQFCASLDERPGMSIVDFAGVNQSTVSYVTNLEHRLYSDDFVYHLDECFGSGDAFFANQSDPKRVARFMENTAGCLNQQFDGALVWDGLQYLTQPLLEPVLSRLHSVLRPGSYLLAVFSSDETSAEVPAYSYRIADHRTLQLVPKGTRKAAQPFNNRSLEKLFQSFESVKFFLTRDQLREVIVRR
jgi:hypothetical protein